LSEYKFRKSENGTDRMTVPQLFYSKKYEAWHSMIYIMA
jgi:hypothetical protein